MKILSLAIQKGGAGKTTSALALATEFAERGYKVALMDADPQASATTFWGLGPVASPWAEPAVALHVPELRDGSISVFRSGRPLEEAKTSEVRQYLARRDVDADIMIIDGPPGGFRLNEAIVEASDMILIPVDGPMAVPGLRDIVRFARGLSPAPTIRALFLTGQDRFTFSKDTKEAIDRLVPGGRLPITIPFSPSVKAMPNYRLPITLLDRDSSSATAYARVADLLLADLMEADTLRERQDVIPLRAVGSANG